MKTRMLLLLGCLIALAAQARAVSEPLGSTYDAALREVARQEVANAPVLPASAWEYPPLADPSFRDRLGYDVSTSHYARGRTLIMHIFINHPGVSWTTGEMDASGAKSDVAKDYYRQRSPWGANIGFDSEGSNWYWYYNPTINWVIPNDPHWTTTDQACEDACAAIGFTDANGNGTRVDDMTLFLQNWGGGYDNVIMVFQPHVNGRSYSDFYKGRCVLYMNTHAGVFAHEWGHNYHACDEYQENGHCWNCDCGPCTEGFYLQQTVNNGNCELPQCPLHDDCVMNRGTIDVAPCVYSSGQWSWSDGDNNGYLNDVKRCVSQNSYVMIWELLHYGWFVWNNVNDGMSISQRWNNWNVIGLRSPPTADYDMTLYGDNNHNFTYASSAYGAGAIDFVVGDYNHGSTGNEHIGLTHYSGDWSTYNITWEGGSEMLYPDGIVRTEDWWTSPDVRVWDIPLFAGEQVTFNLANPSGNIDFGMALFTSNGAAYYAGRSQATWQRDAVGVGGSESYTWTAPANDVYGFVVWANNAANGTVAVQIGPNPQTMAESVVYTSSAPLSLYNYDPYVPYWVFVGARAIGSNNMTLRLFDDPSYQQLLDLDTWDGNALRFFAVDYNDGWSRDYLRVIPGSGTTSYRTEWEQGQDILNGIEQLSWTSPHIGKIWDVYLDAGTPYFLREYHDTSGSINTGIGIFSSADGDRVRNSAEAAASSTDRPPSAGGEWVSYTPSASDWYGISETVINEASGTTSLWFGPRFTFAENGMGYRPERVVWGVEPVTSMYWNVFSARAEPGQTAVVQMFADDAYSGSQYLAGDGPRQVSFVVGDFNHNPRQITIRVPTGTPARARSRISGRAARTCSPSRPGRSGALRRPGRREMSSRCGMSLSAATSPGCSRSPSRSPT